jgi:hypothetical protein
MADAWLAAAALMFGARWSCGDRLRWSRTATVCHLPTLAAVRYPADRHQVEYDKPPISETSAPDAKRSNRMDFTIGLNIGEDGKILIHIRIPEDEGFTINEAERFRDLLDKQITVARSMSDGEENTRRFRN